MVALKYTLASLSMLVGAAFALMLFVFVVVGAANTKPEDWPMIRAMMIGMAALGVFSLGGAIWMLVVSRPLTATAIGGLPIAVFCGILIYTSLQR